MDTMTHDDAIDKIKAFFSVTHYDKANHILGSLLEARIASIAPQGGIVMPELDTELREFFQKESNL